MLAIRPMLMCPQPNWEYDALWADSVLCKTIVTPEEPKSAQVSVYMLAIKAHADMPPAWLGI